MSAATRAGRWLAALALVFVPFASEHFETPRLVLVALAAVLLASGARPSGRALSGLLLAWVGVALVGTVSSTSLALSFPALVAVLALAAFSVGASAFEPWPLLVVAWPIAGYALVQRAGLDPLPWTAQATWCGAVRPFSTLGHPGQLAGWVSLVLPFALDEAAARPGRRRAFAVATLALLIITGALTLARVGWASAAAGAVAWALFRRPGWRAVGVGLLGTVAALGLTLAWRGQDVLERARSFFDAPTRVHLAQSALAAFQEHPVLGFGLDTFTLVSQRHRVAEAWRYEWGATPQHAHALVPQVAATLGAVGLGLLLVAAVVLTRAAWRAWERRSVPAGVVGAVVAFVVGALLTLQGVAVEALGLACCAWLVRGAWGSEMAQEGGGASDAVSSGAVSSGAVSSGAVSSGAVSSGAVSSGAVSSDSVSSGAVSRDAVPSGAASSGAASSGAVSSGSVSSGSVSSGAVSSGVVSSGAVSSGALSSGAVPSDSASSGAVSSGALSSGALSSRARSASEAHEERVGVDSARSPDLPGHTRAELSWHHQPAKRSRFVTRAGALLALALTTPSLLASLAARQAGDRSGADAVAWFSWAGRVEPWNPRWPTEAGAVWETEARAGDVAAWARARDAYAQALALQPVQALHHANLARALAGLGDAEHAQAEFVEAEGLAPRDARIRLDAADAALRLHREAWAEAELLHLVSTWPGWGPPWWTLAVLRATQGRVGEERAALEQGLRGDWVDWPEGEGVARARLAAVLAGQGDLEAARAVARSPASAEAHDACGAPRRMR